MKSFFVIVAMLLAAPCVQAAKCKVDGHWYDYSHPKCRGRSAPAPASSSSDRSRSETTARSSNPACSYSSGKVEADSKKHFKKQYPDSHATQNMLHKANMKDYRAVCGLDIPAPLRGSLERLFQRYYPSYSTIEMLFRAEVEAYSELK